MEKIHPEALSVSPLLHTHVSRFAQPGIEGITTEVASRQNISCPSWQLVQSHWQRKSRGLPKRQDWKSGASCSAANEWGRTPGSFH
jgi:hypothetical protein